MSKRTATFSLLASTKREWLKALRSGNYKQTVHSLHDSFDKGYCCLGVLCRVAGYKRSQLLNKGFPQEVGFGVELLPQKYQKMIADGRVEEVSHGTSVLESSWKVRHKGRMVALSNLNDEEQLSFKQIADIIEKQVPTHK